MKPGHILRSAAAAALALTTPAWADAPSAAAKGDPEILRVPRPAGPEWFGLYIKGSKVGTASEQLRTDTFEGQPVVVVVSEVSLTAKVGDVKTHREERVEKYFERKEHGRLVAFRIEHSGDGGNVVDVGRCSAKAIHLVRTRPGFPREEKDLAPTVEILEAADKERLVAFSKKPFEGKELDEDELSDKGTRTRWLSEGMLTAAGVQVPVIRVETIDEKDNTPVVETIDKEGRILEIKFGEVMVGKAEPEATAKKLDEVDLFALTRVKLAHPLGQEVRNVPQSLVYKVTGLDEHNAFPSTRQKLARQPDGSMQLTVSALLPKAHAKRPEQGKDGELADSLKATLAIESDKPDVKAVAAEVVGKTTDAYEASKKLIKFVNGYLAKAYGSSSDRCTEVLATRKGDCTEHALLFTCLARAVGIPARRVDGLVYMDNGDGVPALYWHEWAEVWVGEWVAMDPTFKQDVADATHIALGGEGSTQSAGLIGQLQFELLSPK